MPDARAAAGRTAASRAARFSAVLPGVRTARQYERAWVGPDLIGGLTVGAMLIPQSMAYAELARLPPEYGFHAVIGALIIYALVGTSRHLGVGPEPGTAILAATGVTTIAAGDPARYITLMAALALVVSAICVVAAIARLGFLASALSKPVLVGYITGVGLTLLSSQIANVTGLRIAGDRFFPRVWEFLRELADVHGATLAVGMISLVLILTLRRVAPRIPGALVVIVLASVAVALFGLEGRGVVLVGPVTGGLAAPRIPSVSFSDLVSLLPLAAGIALVGYTDNLLTARSLAERHRYRIDPNQELLALGLTNLAAGLSQGFPISSSASRTAVPASLGSRTQAVSVVAAGSVVIALFTFGDLLAEIPRAALGAVIVAAAIAIIDVSGYRSLWTINREEAALAVVAALGVIVFDVLIGVLIAVVLSVVVALRRIALPHDAILGDSPSSDGWVAIGAYDDAVAEPGLLVYRFDAPLFFVNADRFAERVERAIDENPGSEEWVVLDFEGIGALDTTAVDRLRTMTEVISARGISLVSVARANDAVLVVLRRAGLLGPVGPLRSFPTIAQAAHAFRERNGT